MFKQSAPYGSRPAAGLSGRRQDRRPNHRRLASPLALALEPRFMFDAAGVATGGEAAVDAAAQEAADRQTDNPQPDDAADPLAAALSAGAPPADRQEVVFVDPNITDVEALLSGVHPAAEVVILDPDGDGLRQIADHLADRTDIDAVHIISHGRAGAVTLGGLTLDLTAVETRTTDLATIGDALAPDGDILVYGCNVAAGNSGAAFVDALAQATGADIAASTDNTGAADRGGDWHLEHQTGAVDADPAIDASAQAAFTGVLAARVIEVTISEDILDEEDGETSLREAIRAAQGLFDEPVTIVFADGIREVTLSRDGDDDRGGDLDIRRGEILITGGDEGVTIIQETADRVFDVSVVGNVTFDNLIITGGDVRDGDGGGIRALGLAAQVTVINSRITGNTATSGNGGGIAVLEADTRLTIVNSTIDGNGAVRDPDNGFTGQGGGLFWRGGSGTIETSTIDGNTAGTGGGIYIERDGLSIESSTISNNNATRNNGGGIAVRESDLSVSNSTISGNTSRSSGAAIYYLSTDDAALSLTHVTVTDNNATRSTADGILVDRFTASDNATTVNLVHSIIAGNGFSGNGDISFVGFDDGETFVRTNEQNLIGNTNLDGLGVRGLDPRLDVLADNGGPTQTHALLAGGQALDAATSSERSTDQRGEARSGSAADIGAFEAQAPTANPDTLSTPEDIPLSLPAPDLLANDTDPDTGDAPAIVGVVSTTTAQGGTLVLRTEGGRVAEISYTPPENFSGTDTFTYIIRDRAGLEAQAPVTIEVTAVNDDPTVVGALPASITVTEDTVTAISDALGLVLEDVDAGINPITLTIEAGQGTLSAEGTAAVSVAGSGSNAIVLTGTVADLNAFLATAGAIRYLGAADANGDGADTLTLTANDGGNTGAGGGDDVVLGAVPVNITAVNDDPTVVGELPASITVAEDTVTGISDALGLVLEDVDAGSEPITLTIEAGLGTLTADGTAAVGVAGSGAGAIVLTGSIADLNAFLATAGTLQYTGAANANGDVADTLTLTANDGGNTGLGGGGDVVLGTVSVTITAVNDAPTIAGPAGPIEVAPTASVTLTGLSIGDVDETTNPGGTYTVTLTVGDGSLAAAIGLPGVAVTGAGTGTLTLTGNLADINAALAGGIVFTAPLVFDGADLTLSASVSDNGHAGSGGPLSDTVAIALTVSDDTDPVLPASGGGDSDTATPTGAGTQTSDAPATLLNNTGGAPEVLAGSLTGGPLSGDLPGPAADGPGTPVLFGIPVSELAGGLPAGTELAGFTGAADLLASLNPAAGQNPVPAGDVDLDLHGFPVGELAPYLVGSFELSTLNDRDDVLALVAASTDGGTVTERYAVMQLLERLGLFADGSVGLAELRGEIDLFGMSLGALADALDGTDLTTLSTLADLQAALGLPAVAAPAVPDAAAAAEPIGAPAFTAQIAGAFQGFDRNAAILGTALARIPSAEAHPLGA